MVGVGVTDAVGDGFGVGVGVGVGVDLPQPVKINTTNKIIVRGIRNFFIISLLLFDYFFNRQYFNLHRGGISNQESITLQSRKEK
jgi:predicted acyltransferase